ncbi:MAG: formate dehydrogenase accessory protein FdhE [Candidatus Zixiibacteriota bacterium]
MNAPGQVISRSDRQQAERFTLGLRETNLRLHTTELFSAVIREHVQGWSIDTRPEGSPLFARVEVPLPVDHLVSYARELVLLLCDHVSEKFHNINGLVSDPAESPKSISALTNLTLSGSGAAVAEFSRRQGLPLEILAFFAVYLVRPIRQAAADLAADQGRFKDWPYGYCPVCGLWSRMGQIDAKEGGMQLWCIGCDHGWRFPRLRCPFCMEKDQIKLGYLQVDSSDKFRAYSCDSCRRYLKTIVVPENTMVDLDAEYLASSAVDITAAFEGYIQDFVGYAAFDMQDNPASQAYRQRAMM